MFNILHLKSIKLLEDPLKDYKNSYLKIKIKIWIHLLKPYYQMNPLI